MRVCCLRPGLVWIPEQPIARAAGNKQNFVYGRFRPTKTARGWSWWEGRLQRSATSRLFYMYQSSLVYQLSEVDSPCCLRSSTRRPRGSPRTGKRTRNPSKSFLTLFGRVNNPNVSWFLDVCSTCHFKAVYHPQGESPPLSCRLVHSLVSRNKSLSQ